jgi:hypothetical protein
MWRASRLRSVAGWLLLGFAVVSTVWVLLFVTDFATEYLELVVPASVALCLWGKWSANRIPVFPMVVVQQAVVLGMPILRRSATVRNFAPELTATSAHIFALFCGALMFGWLIGGTGRSGNASRFGFNLARGPNSDARIFPIGIALMVVGLVMRTMAYLFPEYFFSGWFESFYPVYRSFQSAAELGGSFIAALFLGLCHGGRAKAILYWSLILALTCVSTASLLLSSAMSVLFSAIIGTAAGRGRIPWILVGATFAIVSFLHVGKFDMRLRYQDPKTTQDQRTLFTRTVGLPLFYLQWCETSLHNIFSDQPTVKSAADEDRGLLSRFDNLQNLNAVLDSMKSGVPLFGGRSYTMIPMLAIPRLLWPDKPRTHDAQVQFNIHFGRQKDEKETFQTYIAVGLLPEAVGNFGTVLGPVMIGLVLGWAAGWLERVASNKQIVSLEGMLIFAVTSHLALSFEMSAAVLITATLQIACGVLGGYLLLGLGGFTMTYAPSSR